MSTLKSLILLASPWLLFGCQSSAMPDRSQSAQRALPRLRPLLIWAARELNLPAYTLDHKRGTLAPSAQRFSLPEGYAFRAFASGQYSAKESIRYWIQTELAPPEFVIVTLDDVDVGEFEPDTIEPSYLAKTRGKCPLFVPRPTRLAPLDMLPMGTSLFLFHEPMPIGTDETASDFPTWPVPTTYYGYYPEPYVNVHYLTRDGSQHMGFISALCLSHPTPAPARSFIGLHELGEPSRFIESLVSQLRLAEPGNLASSDREIMRLNQEKCVDILAKIEPVTDALPHGPVGDETPTAAVFLCADKDASGAVTYHMAPRTIGVEMTLRNFQSVELLVINLTPPDPVGNSERALDFGAYSYNDVYRTAHIRAERMFEAQGSVEVEDTTPGIYRVEAGIRNALWLYIESKDQSNFNRFQFSSGSVNQNVLSEHYTEGPWWDFSTSVTGQIVHE